MCTRRPTVTSGSPASTVERSAKRSTTSSTTSCKLTAFASGRTLRDGAWPSARPSRPTCPSRRCCLSPPLRRWRPPRPLCRPTSGGERIPRTRCRGAGRVGKAGDKRFRRGEGRRERVAKVPGGERNGQEGDVQRTSTVPVVLHEFGFTGAGSETLGGTLSAGQSNLPGRHLRKVLCASQFSQKPHANKTPPPVGKDENVKVELRVGQLTFEKLMDWKVGAGNSFVIRLN
ncbi:unnamed protein product, partial [Brenthis ino]